MNLALFDLDNTLLIGDSDYQWNAFLIKQGIVDQAYCDQRNDHFYEQYKAGTLDIIEYLRFAAEPLSQLPRPTLDSLHADFMRDHIQPIIPQKARDLLAAHQAQGDVVMIITATNSFVTEPIARELGVAHLIAAELATDTHGNFTGEPVGTPSFQQGKITRLNEWLVTRGETLASYDKTFFYSDSHNDLPLLSIVSNPVVVDADDTLKAHATAQGWPQITLRD